MDKKQLIVVGAVILLISTVCFAKEETTLKLISGVTTQQEVIRAFSNPDEVTKDKDGNEIWIFKKSIKIDDANTGKEYSGYLLELTFNKKGILINSDIKPAGSKH